MTITKEVLNDKIEVVQMDAGFPVVQVRTATIIKEDGVVLTKNFHRHTVHPNADLSQEDTDVSTICSSVFTDEVKTAYASHLSALLP